MSKGEGGSDEEVEGGIICRRRSLLASFCWTSLIIVLLLYGGLLGIGRTEGFRVFFADGLSSVLGMPVSLGRCHLSLDLKLHATDLVVKAPVPASHTVLEAKRALIVFQPRRAWRGAPGSIRAVELEEAGLVVRPDAQGLWSPPEVHAFMNNILHTQGLAAPVPRYRAAPADMDPGAPAPLPPPPRRVRAAEPQGPMPLDIRVRNAHVIYQDADGSLVGSITGMDMERVGLAVPARTLRYGRFAASEIRFRELAVAGMAFSWIEAEHGLVLLDAQMGQEDREPSPAPVSAAPAPSVAEPAAVAPATALRAPMPAVPPASARPAPPAEPEEESPEALRERIRQSLQDAFKP